jgi:predicted nucleic acid-binding protein
VPIGTATITVKVVDASAYAALLFGEPQGETVASQLETCRLIAPDLLDHELTNICLTKLRRKQAPPEQLILMLASRNALQIERLPVDADAVLALAIQTGLTAYDAAYLWLARGHGAGLVTLDKQLAAAAGR